MNTTITTTETTANMLGALALVLADDIREATDTVLGHTGETAAALVTIGSNENMTTTQLAMALGLAPPSASRLIDRLAQMDMVTRVPNDDDRRSSSLHLAPKGEKMREKILKMRRAVVAEAVAHLSDEDQSHLDRTLRSILLRLTTSEARAYAFCRLCHEEICVPKDCPVESRCREHEAAR